MQDNDAQLQLKKRARRRLVGAVAFVSVVAVVLPMEMDHDPRKGGPEGENRITGRGEKPLAQTSAASAGEKRKETPQIAAQPRDT